MIKPFILTDYEDQQCNRLCNSWVAAAIVGTGAISAATNYFTSSKAADAQKNATNQAAAMQMQQYAQTRKDLEPYRMGGERAYAELEKQLPFLTSPIDISKELQDPNSVSRKAYDFTRTQGLKAVQNSAIARGLGLSGAALKGAQNFATGLANNTWTDLFNRENINRTNTYNRLKGLVDTGVNAATGTGQFGVAAAQGTSEALIGGANAEAAMWNKLGSSVRDVSRDIGGYMAYKGLYGNNQTSPGYYGGSPSNNPNLLPVG